MPVHCTYTFMWLSYEIMVIIIGSYDLKRQLLPFEGILHVLEGN